MRTDSPMQSICEGNCMLQFLNAYNYSVGSTKASLLVLYISIVVRKIGSAVAAPTILSFMTAKLFFVALLGAFMVLWKS